MQLYLFLQTFVLNVCRNILKFGCDLPKLKQWSFFNISLYLVHFQRDVLFYQCTLPIFTFYSLIYLKVHLGCSEHSKSDENCFFCFQIKLSTSFLPKQTCATSMVGIQITISSFQQTPNMCSGVQDRFSFHNSRSGSQCKSGCNNSVFLRKFA